MTICADNTIVGRLILLGNTMETFANELLRPLNISYTEFDILATLCRSGPPYQLTPTQLRASVLLTSGAMTNALNRIERSGFIERVGNPKDGRSKAAKLTKGGIRVAKEAAGLRFKLAGDQVRILTKDERSALTKLLKKLAKKPDNTAQFSR